MEKLLKLPVSIQITEYVEQKSILIDFGTISVAEWCLGLVLLSEELIDTLKITNDSESWLIEFRKEPQVSSSTRIEGKYVDNNICLHLSEHELEYWLHFFLEYYRDGAAAVDHIDVDIEDPSSHGIALSMTLKIANILPPVSAEEARRILGI